MSLMPVTIPDHGRRFGERHGGWLLSCSLHVMVFALLAMHQADRPVIAPAPRSLVIKLQPEIQAPPTPPTAQPAPSQAQSTETAMLPTAIEPAEATAAAVSVEEENAAPKAAETGIIQENAYTPEQQAVIDQLRQRAELMRQEGRLMGMKGSSEVEQRLNALDAQDSARRMLFSSEGVDRGAVRKVILTGAPPAAVDKIMERYGIVIKVANLNGNEKRPGFINFAATPEGQFASLSPKGRFTVFSYGPAAMARMAQLEDKALREGGYDPSTSRVVSVVFGVVKAGAGWDLGVKQIQIEPVPQ